MTQEDAIIDVLEKQLKAAEEMGKLVVRLEARVKALETSHERISSRMRIYL